MCCAIDNPQPCQPVQNPYRRWSTGARQGDGSFRATGLAVIPEHSRSDRNQRRRGQMFGYLCYVVSVLCLMLAVWLRYKAEKKQEHEEAKQKHARAVEVGCLQFEQDELLIQAIRVLETARIVGLCHSAWVLIAWAQENVDRAEEIGKQIGETSPLGKDIEHEIQSEICLIPKRMWNEQFQEDEHINNFVRR